MLTMILMLALGCGEMTEREGCEQYETLSCECGDNPEDVCTDLDTSLRAWCGNMSDAPLEADEAEFTRCMLDEYSDTCEEAPIVETCCNALPDYPICARL